VVIITATSIIDIAAVDLSCCGDSISRTLVEGGGPKRVSQEIYRSLLPGKILAERKSDDAKKEHTRGGDAHI
jgi:hypothetical protein